MKRMYGVTLILTALWSALFPIAALQAQTSGTSSPLGIDFVSSHSRSAAYKNFNSRAFSSTQPNEVLLAFFSVDAPQSVTNQVNYVTGAGLTWQLVARSNAQLGDAEIWRAFAATPLTNVTITANLRQAAAGSMTIIGFTGADTSGTNGSGAIGATGTFSADPGAPNGSVQTTRAGSWVFGVGNDWDTAIARTLGPNQTMIHQYLASVNNTYWVQRQSSPTATPGTTVAINDTAPQDDRYDLAIVEVLPAIAAAPTPDFTLSASPSDQSIAVGGSASYTASVLPQNGYSGTVNLSISGVPQGATAAFNPTTLNGSGSSQLNIATDGTIAAGIYPLTITATDGTLTHTASVTLNVSSAPDFTMSISPASQSLQPGSSTTFGITIAGQNGFSAASTLAVTGLPGGATGAFNPATVNGSGTSQLTINTDSTLAAGTYPIAISATSGSLSHSANATLTVNGSSSAPFGIDSVASGDLSSGSSVASTGTFSTSQPNELLLAFVSAGSAQNAVSGVSGGGLTWEPVSRANTQPGDAEIWRAFAASPLSNVSVSATLAQSAAWSITVVTFTGADASGTNGSGAIGSTGIFGGASGAPAGSVQTTRAGSWVLGVGADGSSAATIAPDSNQVVVHQYPATDVNNSYWVQRQNTPTASVGSAVSIDDTAPTADAYNLALVEVLPATAQTGNPDFSVLGSPSSQSIGVGGSATFTATLTAQNGYSAAVNFSVGGLPPGATGAFNPATLNGSGTSQLAVTTDGTVAPGTYPLTITATDGTLTHTANVSLVISAAAGFTLAASPASQSVLPGSNATYNATITGQNGYTAAANLTVSGLPAGATGSFIPATVNGSGTSQLIVSAGSTVTPGTYGLTITATSGSLTQTANVTLVMSAAPDFTMAAAPTSQSVTAGLPTTYGVNITAQNGYSGTATLAVTGLPTGATAQFTPASVSGSGTAQLTVSTAGLTPPGTYPLTITAISGSLTHAANVTLLVTSPPDFTMSATPASRSVPAGSATTYSVNITAQNGYSGTATLAVSGLPTGATASFNPGSVAGSATAQLNVSTTRSTAVGTYVLTITATSGSLSHSASATLVVTAAPDFSITAGPASQSVLSGASTTFTVTLTALNGYASSTTFSVSGLPAGATGSFNPTSVTGSGSTQLTVTTSSSTAAGTYPLTVTASGGGITNTASATLAVVVPIQHSVAITWSDTDLGIAGYNVYRPTASPGNYVKLNSSLVTTMSYTDATVQSGTTYYYVITAVDSSGVESAFSTAVQAQIPTP
jgi:uncharacterized membrane protein